MANVHIVINDEDSIEAVVGLASITAKATSRTLSFRFNGYSVIVGPNHNPEVVIKDYIKKLSMFREED